MLRYVTSIAEINSFSPNVEKIFQYFALFLPNLRQQQQKNKIYCDIHPSLKCLHTTCETVAFQLWKIYGLDKNITLCNMYICMDKGPSFCQHIFFFICTGLATLFCWKFIIFFGGGVYCILGIKIWNLKIDLILLAFSIRLNNECR